MTSLQIDISSQTKVPQGSSFVEEFGTVEKKEERKSESTQEEIIENMTMNEEEPVKSDTQDDISSESYLLPCCKLCDNPEKLFFHVKQHHEKDATKCVLCGRELSSKSSLDRHLLIHAKWQPYKCSHCNKQFSTNGNMHRHKKTHKGLCDGPSKTSEKRKKNADVTPEKELQPKKKMPCSKEQSVCDIADARRKQSVLDGKIFAPSSDTQPDAYPPADDKTLKTLQSVSSSTSKEEFIMTLGLKTACQIESKSESSGTSNILSDSQIEDSPQHESEICARVDDIQQPNSALKSLLEYKVLNFVKKSTATSQDETEHSDSPFIEEFQVPKGNVDGNKQHSDWLPETPETSTEGLKLFPEAEPLDKGKPQLQYVCQYCKKQFKKKNIFRKHLAKHKKKPFKCTICKAKLLSRQNALRHVMTQHKKRRQAKSFIVESIDGIPSSDTETLCEWCGQEFTSSVTLKTHNRASKGCQAKPFICLICSKSFVSKNNGKRHQAKHHKDEQADCCIVSNTAAKSREVRNPLSKILGRSIFTSRIATDELQESSVECRISESEHPDKSELSLPKKELDAAQSLIDMFSSLPPHGSSDETVIHQNDIANSSPAPDSSRFYFFPSEVQNKPLDLSVHPIDLSSKHSEDASRSHAPHNLPILTSPFSHKDRNNDTGFFHVNKSIYVPSETPLNLVKKNHFKPSLHSSVQSRSFELKSPMEFDEVRQKECKSHASYECDICCTSFSSNSNKRRHEKTKHFMHCEVPQISPLSATESPKSVLSRKTKVALFTKVISNKHADLEMADYPINSSSAGNQPLAILSNELENGDLASVSSLINTANSPQLKKYLTGDDNACDAAATPEESLKDEDNDQGPQKAVDQTVVISRGSSKHWCDICQKDFTCKSSYNRHSAKHTDQRDFHCQECKQTFTTKSNRDRHIRRKHPHILSSGNKKLPSKKQQNIPEALVPTGSTTIEDVKDYLSDFAKELTLPKEMVNREISQCNKENQRLFMPS